MPRARQQFKTRFGVDVAAALPGDNPVAAALAAGLIPSPEMIAASRDPRVPSVALAWALFAAFVAGVVLSASLNDRALHRLGVETSPAVLVARAAEFARAARDGATAADSAYWFSRQRTYQQQTLHLDPTFQLWATRNARQTGMLRFVYRESPRPLTASNVFGVVLYRDPPADLPGMVDVNLDQADDCCDWSAFQIFVSSRRNHQPWSTGASG